MMHLERKYEPHEWMLYAIIDTAFLRSRAIGLIAEELILGGVSVIQYRDKQGNIEQIIAASEEIMSITQNTRVPFIINDSAEVALKVNADGVHLGPEDDDPDRARKLLGGGKIIGYSVRDQKDVKKIKNYNINYLGIGALFPTETHSRYPVMGLKNAARIRQMTDLPLVGIGGILLSNIESALSAGCNSIAVISALLNSENIGNAARTFVNKIEAFKRINENCDN